MAKLYPIMVKALTMKGLPQQQATYIAQKYLAGGMTNMSGLYKFASKIIDPKGNLAKRFVKGSKKRAQDIQNVWATDYKVAEGVGYRSQPYFNPHTGKANVGTFAEFKDLPIIDIDVPIPGKPPSHHAWQMSVKNYDEGLENLHQFTKANTDSYLRIYKTPAGLRSFDLSKKASPIEYYKGAYGDPNKVYPDKKMNWASILGDDTGYQNFNKARGSFAARLGQKAGRADDTVARHIMDMGQASNIIPGQLGKVKVYHDFAIKQILENPNLWGWETVLKALNTLKGAEKQQGIIKLSKYLNRVPKGG